MKIRITDSGPDERLVALQLEDYGPVDLFRVYKSRVAEEPRGLIHIPTGYNHDGFISDRRRSTDELR